MTSAMEMGTAFTGEFKATQRKLRALDLVKRARLAIMEKRWDQLDEIAIEMAALNTGIDASRINVCITSGLSLVVTIDGVDAPEVSAVLDEVMRGAHKTTELLDDQPEPMELEDYSMS